MNEFMFVFIFVNMLFLFIILLELISSWVSLNKKTIIIIMLFGLTVLAVIFVAIHFGYPARAHEEAKPGIVRRW